jgi:acid phosphatase (class A)
MPTMQPTTNPRTTPTTTRSRYAWTSLALAATLAAACTGAGGSGNARDDGMIARPRATAPAAPASDAAAPPATSPAVTAAPAVTPSAAATAGPKPGDAAAKADRAYEVKGYLPRETPVSSLAFLPPPPAPGTAAFAHDEQVARDLQQQLRGSARWKLAAQDANLTFPNVASSYACALDVEISPIATPALVRLFQRSERDLSRANASAKDHYLRRRPFVVHGEPTCVPEDEEDLRNNGSYPSGHAGRGWLWGMIASEVAPERAPALMARGRAFAESRAVCNVHWRSDVLAARDMAATVFGQLHGSAAFRADLAAAQAEVTAARARGAAPNRDCAAEAAALAELPSIPY